MTNILVICPVCYTNHLKSTVTSLGSSRKLLGYTPYWDEDGRYHNHDPNEVTQGYKCSNGHIWQVVTTPFCENAAWCHYQVPYPQTTIIKGEQDDSG